MLTLPTLYLSYSQLDLWHADKGEYWNRYFRGIKPPPNIWTDFGSRFAAAMEAVHETGELPADAPERMEDVIGELSVLDQAEYRAMLDTDLYSLIGYFDTSNRTFDLVIDYKTGGKPWDQERAENHKQLHLYALMVKERHSVTPRVGIEWAETTTDLKANLVQLTGRVEKFYYRPTPAQLDQARAWIDETAHDISRHYEAWIGKDFDAYIFDQYAEVQAQLAHYKALEKRLKDEYTEMMQKYNLTRFEVEGGSFSTYERKSWKYSPEVDAQVKALQEAAQAGGQAEEVSKQVFAYRKRK